MTESEKIKYLRVMDDQGFEGDSDDVLSVYLAIAKDKVLNARYPFSRPEGAVIEPKYEITQCNIAMYLLHKRGAENEVTHTENGITRQYEAAGVPRSLLRDVVPLASVPGGRRG